MSGPHRYVSDARHALAAAFESLPVGSRVLLGVSGGSDSMALAASAVFAARERGIQLSSITVDHGLRPESGAEARRVVEFLTGVGIDAHLSRVRVGNDAGPEADARRARYDAIASLARELGGGQAIPVLLGHTADDQAETVLLGLARGSGARSIAGMRQAGALPHHEDVPMVRPLLGMRREELRTVCTELGWPIVDDPSNLPDGPWRAADGSALRRSAIRHRAIPALSAAIGHDAVPALARTAALLRADDDYLSQLADEVWPEVVVEDARPEVVVEDARPEVVVDPDDARPEATTDSGASGANAHTVVVDCRKLANEAEPVRTRVLRRAALEAGARAGELTFWHVSSLDMLITTRDNKLGIDLPGVRAWRENNYLRLG